MGLTNSGAVCDLKLITTIQADERSRFFHYAIIAEASGLASVVLEEKICIQIQTIESIENRYGIE